MAILCARDITSAWDDLVVHGRLTQFARQFGADPHPFQSLVVLFHQPTNLSEAEFEQALWARLQSLADKDHWRGASWDRRVSPDPADPQFALSFAGEAFFAVGLHPAASRPSRRFQSPALVFNPHQQFEALRAQKKYEQIRATILERDERISGSPNPMLARHGDESAALQYSGRHVEDGWRCPFVSNAKHADKKPVDDRVEGW